MRPRRGPIATLTTSPWSRPTDPGAAPATLQRARAALDIHRASGRLRPASTPDPVAERALAARFTAAWHVSDIPALVSVLAEDCLLTMPPAPLAYRGRDAIGAFFATVPAGGDLTAIRLIPIRAYGIMVLTIRAGLIGEITGFADPSLFRLFGLPQQADWPVKLAGGISGL